MVMGASLALVPLIGNASSVSVDLATGLISYYTLDEESGVRYDSVEVNDLADNNTVLYSTGLYGNSAAFVAASSEYLSKSSVSGFPSGSSGWSISYWWKSSTDNTVPIEWGTTGSLTRIEVYHPADQVGILLNGANIYFTATNVNDGNWHHIVIIFDGGALNSTNARVYMDNSSLSYASGSANTPNISATPNLYIGRSVDGLYVNGYIDEVGFWSTQLDADDVALLWNSGSGITYLPTSTTSTSTATTTTSTLDVDSLIWIMELYLSLFSFLIFTYVGYKFTKLFI